MTASDPGFSIHDQMFQRSDAVAVLKALDRAEVVRTKAGVRHVLAVPAVRALVAESALIAIARQYVGAGAFPFRATLFNKSRSANWLVRWHQDTTLPIQRRSDRADWGPWSVKGGVLHAIAPASALTRIVALRVHLDDSTLDNGPLRVLPRTHVEGVLSDVQISRLAAAVTPVACVAAAGGVVAMRPLTVHASSKARSDQPRRVLHIEFGVTSALDDGIELAVG